VRTLAGMVPEQGQSPTARSLTEYLAIQLLRGRPQIASLHIGGSEGSFLVVQRSPEEALDTKLIEQNGTRRQITWHRRDEAGQVKAVEIEPAGGRGIGRAIRDTLLREGANVVYADKDPGVTGRGPGCDAGGRQ
jgi:hypothetical protein